MEAILKNNAMLLCQTVTYYIYVDNFLSAPRTTTTTLVQRPLFQDNLGKPVPER